MLRDDRRRKIVRARLDKFYMMLFIRFENFDAILTKIENKFLNFLKLFHLK